MNYDISLSMPDEYIFEGILLKDVVIENDSSKRKGYRADIVENNDENNLHHAIGALSINELGILSSYIYININKSKQNQYLKLISAIYNLSDNNVVENHNNNPRLVISYNSYNDGKPLNDWNNHNFFPIAFLTLFLYEDGSHIALQSIKVSLYAWAKWALSHHSKHFAWYTIFMYIVYDVI